MSDLTQKKPKLDKLYQIIGIIATAVIFGCVLTTITEWLYSMSLWQFIGGVL